MSFERQLNRNKLKKKQGNNKIRQAWRDFQIQKYGIGKWCKMYNASQKVTNKANKIEPSTAYYV